MSGYQEPTRINPLSRREARIVLILRGTTAALLLVLLSSAAELIPSGPASTGFLLWSVLLIGGLTEG